MQLSFTHLHSSYLFFIYFLNETGIKKRWSDGGRLLPVQQVSLDGIHDVCKIRGVLSKLPDPIGRAEWGKEASGSSDMKQRPGTKDS